MLPLIVRNSHSIRSPPTDEQFEISGRRPYSYFLLQTSFVEAPDLHEVTRQPPLGSMLGCFCFPGIRYFSCPSSVSTSKWLPHCFTYTALCQVSNLLDRISMTNISSEDSSASMNGLVRGLTALRLFSVRTTLQENALGPGLDHHY